MDSEDMYKFIGYAVVVIFFIYLISKALSLNVRIIEGAANMGDSKKGIKDNKYDDEGKGKDSEKTSKSNKMKLTNKEKQNEDNKKEILDRKENTKDILSATYNHNLNVIINVASSIGSSQDSSKMDIPDQATIDKYNKLKSMKDYLDILEFAYNEVDELK